MKLAGIHQISFGWDNLRGLPLAPVDESIVDTLVNKPRVGTFVLETEIAVLRWVVAVLSLRPYFPMHLLAAADPPC